MAVRATVYITALLVGLIAALAIAALVFGTAETDRVTANPDARLLAALLAIGPPGALALLVTKSKAGRWPARIGGLAGLLLGLGAYLAISIEDINAATGDAGRQIVAPILEVRTAGRPGNEFYVLRVSMSRKVADLFWGREFPNGASAPGQCLHAYTGVGRLGVRWIGERSIVRCSVLVRSPH